MLFSALTEALSSSLITCSTEVEALLFNDASEALALDTLVLKLVEFSSLIDAIRLSLTLPALDWLAKSLALAI